MIPAFESLAVHAPFVLIATWYNNSEAMYISRNYKL